MANKRRAALTRRRGSLYILTFAAAIVLASLALGTARLIHGFRRYSSTNYHAELAKEYAQGGIRHALHFTNVAPNWRQVLSNGVWLHDIPVDQATYTVQGVDPVDGDLADNADDPVVLTATATVGGVSRSVRVRAVVEAVTSELLRYAVVSATDVNAKHSVAINGDVASNGTISAKSNPGVIGNAEAVGTITGTISGTVTPNCEPKPFPDTAQVVACYTAIATEIPYQTNMTGILLSPTSNPFGPPNPEGVYLVRCGGGSMTIGNCRIVGTLVVDNCGNCVIEDGISWQPSRPEYAALIVNRSGANICPDSGLDEAALNTDFSMPAEPGFGDATDVYPGYIKGTIYIDGWLYVYNDSTVPLVGPVISTDFCWLSNTGRVDADPSIYDNPTLGFFTIAVRPVEGTWRLVAP